MKFENITHDRAAVLPAQRRGHSLIILCRVSAIFLTMAQIRIAPEYIQPHRERNEKCAHGTYYAHEGAGACEQYRDKSQYGGYAVQHSYRLLLAKPNGEETMVEMPLVRMERTLPMQNSAEKCEGRVSKRHSKRQQRHKECYHGVQLEHSHY